jgi:rod shape-determining protein MreD
VNALSVRSQPVAAWLLAPLGLALGLTLLFALPLRIAGLALPEPVFALAPAFAFGLLRPSLFAPLGLLVLGLILDILWGSALGVWPLSLLTAYGMSFAFRRLFIGQDFPSLWLSFGGACALALGAAWGLSALRADGPPDLAATALQWIATLLVFPLAWLLVKRYEEQDSRLR